MSKRFYNLIIILLLVGWYMSLGFVIYSASNIEKTKADIEHCEIETKQAGAL